jgi:hypothetical protein
MQSASRLPLLWKYGLPGSFVSAINPQGESVSLVRSELEVRVMVPPLGAMPGIVDTGAGWCVFPLKRWEPFSEEIEWLEPQDGHSVRLVNHQGIGDTVEARIGRVDIRLAGTNRESKVTVCTRPFSVVGRFLLKHTLFQKIVLGLGGGALDRWSGIQYNAATDPPTAWLVDGSQRLLS